MTDTKARISAQDCIALALECEGDAQIEQDAEHRERLLRMARVVRDLAADLAKLGERNS